MSALARVGVGLLWLLLAGMAGAEQGGTDQSRAGDIRQQQEKRQLLRHQIQALQAELSRIRKQKESLVAELADREREMSALHLKLRDLNHESENLQKQLHQLQNRREVLEKAMREDAARLARLLRSAYVAGRQERLKLFLNQQDPALLNRMLAYHDYIGRERARQLRQLQADTEELQQLAGQIVSRQQALEQTRARAEEQRHSLAEKQQQRQKLLGKIDASLSRKSRRLARWQEDERRLGELLEHIQSTLESLDFPEQKGFRESRGHLPWPLQGRLRKRFGAEKIGNLRWDGVIIDAREGDGVKAVHAGRVAWADWLRGYGLLMIIEHGNGFMTLYGNNQSLFKETGDWVEAGEVIAQAGDGRMDNTAGIYFGIRHKGKALNPVRWCGKHK
ncbi:murein hydrolase activator EnvC family protein [Thiolapillus brandeum]|uniref:Peptidase M23/M37 family protein n=1 Tax=Thiolapillus brandeum TaxID=1076588 RepID=A0A7U6GGN1_9GAMM|nr:peptidoglycan DD-metalloendopeptidase family protein [Thiolapillus brandeum]BAO43287.1 peptidase M23/M37 family protein [Thiolapillus brandeum]